jgi:hypothetical protein
MGPDCPFDALGKPIEEICSKLRISRKVAASSSDRTQSISLRAIAPDDGELAHK